ncbi:MAG: NrfD/PsrC family molybdoenzyme membrane anchor subunit [Vicinamibacterales bacterium]
MSAHTLAERPAPVGGKFFTPAVMPVAVIAGLGVLAILYRFAFGLGASTALNDGYPWGLWIAFDVVTGTALACGGYAMAILVYIANKGEYHPLVRPALLTSAFGYTMAGLSVVLDVGRYWLIWKVPIYFWHWNFNSVLLEVALCIMAYTVVLWIELSPAFLERGRTAPIPWVRDFSEKALPIMRKALLWFIALGMLLPTMHQSSLGSLLLLSGPRLHPLWNTGFLPLLFLISCIGMGYAAVVLEGAISSGALRRAPERDILAGVGRYVAFVGVAYVVLRVGDLAWRGQLAALFAFDKYSILSLLELGLFVAGPLMLATDAQRRRYGNLVRAAMVLILAGGMYRFDVFLVAFNPGAHWSYFPSVGETLVTAGLIALEILGYIFIVRNFPILAGRPAGKGRAAAAS